MNEFRISFKVQNFKLISATFRKDTKGLVVCLSNIFGIYEFE